MASEDAIEKRHAESDTGDAYENDDEPDEW